MALKRIGLDQSAADATRSPLAIQGLDTKALLELRAQIDTQLGIRSISEIDLGHELAMQLYTVKLLQQETMNDPDVPANQKAQTSNSLQAVLKELIKMRTELYSAERTRAIENFIVNAFSKCTAGDIHASAEAKAALKEAKDIFFEAYEALLATHKSELDE